MIICSVDTETDAGPIHSSTQYREQKVFTMQMSYQIVLSAIVLAIILIPTTNSIKRKKLNETWSDIIKQDIFKDYDPLQRPSHHSKTTNVSLTLTLIHFEVDEIRSIITVKCWLHVIWTDDKLKWNPEDYDGVSTLHLPDHEVWQPNFALYNNAEGSTIDPFGHTPVILYNNGEVLWVPPSKLVAFCGFDLRYWPYDTQNCSLDFAFWSYTEKQLNVYSAAVNLDDLFDFNNSWEVKDSSVVRNLTRIYPFINVHYSLVISRRSAIYKAVVVAPSSVIVLLTLTNFWLPPQCGEKVILTGSTAIMISMFLMYFAKILPAISLNTPLILLFYSKSLQMVCFSMALSVLVINITRRKFVQPLPWFLKSLLTSVFGTILLLDTTNLKQRIQPNEYTSDKNSSGHNQQMAESINEEYCVLASALERIVFIVYCITFSILASSS